MKLQIALDFLSLQDVLKISEEVSNYVDILEVGTPLILKEGLKVVKKEIMADLILVKDVYQRSLELQKMGVDYICLHTAFDDQMQDMRPVLLNPEVQEPKEIYYIYRSVCGEEDRKLLEKHNLRFDLVVIPPGKIGQGRSGLAAKAFAMRLMHLNFRVYVVGEVTTLV